jgi:uncharacterized alpha-E superfamily protein
MLDVNLELILDFPSDNSLSWKPLIDTLDMNDIFENKYKKYNEENVLNFIFEGTKNLSSISNCMESANYNIETVRDDLPKSTTISLNDLNDHIAEKISNIHRRHRLTHITKIISLTQNIFGSINDNLSRGYEFEFIRLGRFVERIDMITRIIDCLCVSKNNKQTHDFSTMEWISLLSILSAHDAFRKISRGEVNREEVINFLLKNDSFPRSITRCLTIIENCLNNLPRNLIALDKLKIIKSKFLNTFFEKLDDKSLHLFLDKCQKDISIFDKKIERTYFS